MINKWIERVIALVGIAALLAYCFGILARYAFTWLVPDWTEEVTVYALLWGMLLAGGLLVDRERHLSAGVMHLAAPRLAPYLDRIGLVIALLFCLFLTWQGVELVRLELRLEEVSRSRLQLPLAYVYAIFPFAMAYMSYRYAIKILFTPIHAPSQGSIEEPVRK
ncbi:MAG: TRAP transporter small permease [Alphaproteobacteria bacterium]|nr:TRAP transporter small permease [Alphaproteobacteria bacterium]